MEFTTWGGKRVTPYMAYILNGIAAWLKATFGLDLVLRDAIRTYEEQKAIFLARYVTAGGVNGRRVYDTRWWEGQLWYRVSSAGTVAQPGSSNHEVQGDNAAVDIADSGADSGITVKNSTRGRAIRAAATSLGIEPEGDNFGEGWHFLIRGISRAVPGSTPAPAPAPQPSGSNAWNVLKGLHWHGIAAMLRGTGRYRGNNVPGPIMVSAFQDFLNDSGYANRVFGRNIKVDGDFGTESAKATQAWLKWGPSGGYQGEIDADFGPGTIAAWNRAENANWRAFPGNRA